MLKRIVAIALVSLFIMCGISFAEESSIVQPGSDINGQLDRLTQESAYINGVLTKPHEKETLEPTEHNKVTEGLLDRNIIQQGEALRLEGRQPGGSQEVAQ